MLTDIERRELELIDAVNDASTDVDHRIAEARLRGFRDGLRAAGRSWDWTLADQHTAARYGGSLADDDGPPTCLGVRLDWSESGYDEWPSVVDGNPDLVGATRLVVTRA